VQALESIKDLFKHRDSLRLHFGFANGFLRLCHAFLGWGFISRRCAYG